MPWIKLIKNLIKLLHSNVSPSEIAGGVALGALVGLTPFTIMNKLIGLILIILLNVNVSSAFFSVAVFGTLSLLSDPLANLIGRFLLVDVKSLNSFWTTLYNMPLVPFTKFYNTVVLGSFIISIMLIIPIYLTTKKFIVYYRSNLAPKVEKWKIMKLFKLSSAYSIFDKYKT